MSVSFSRHSYYVKCSINEDARWLYYGVSTREDIPSSDGIMRSESDHLLWRVCSKEMRTDSVSQDFTISVWIIKAVYCILDQGYQSMTSWVASIDGITMVV